MSACSVCSHPDRLAIEQDLLTEPVAWAALRRKYGVHHLTLMSHHRQHMKPCPYSPAVSGGHDDLKDTLLTRVDDVEDRAIISTFNIPPTVPDEVKPVKLPLRMRSVDDEAPDVFTPETPQDVLKLALPHVRKAVRLAGDDRQAQEHIVAVLNHALQCDEEMGLS